MFSALQLIQSPFYTTVLLDSLVTPHSAVIGEEFPAIGTLLGISSAFQAVPLPQFYPTSNILDLSKSGLAEPVLPKDHQMSLQKAAVNVASGIPTPFPSRKTRTIV